jgi:ribosomal protein L11 methyltransferase
MYQWTKPIDPSQCQAWEERLETDAFPGLYLEEDVAAAAFRVVAICPGREQAEELVSRFGGEFVPLEEQDWVALGEQSWRGRWLEVGNRFVVALDEDPGFLASLRERFPGRDLLVIPPELAFGTGDHETTSACLEMLAEFAAEREEWAWSLLDLGTGTAILAIAAFKVGAHRVVGVEFDETAIQVARRNLARNGIPAGEIELHQADVLQWKPGERFDLVCANLYAGVLLRIIPVLSDFLQEGGRVCLSGILQDQEAEVIRALHGAGFSVLQRTARGKWVTLRAGGAESLH